MKIKVINSRGFFEQKTYEFDGNDIEVEVEHGELPKFNLTATVECEGKQKNIAIKDNKFVIPCEMVRGGELKVCLNVYLKETKCKVIPCDRLIIKENDGSVRLIPEIETLRELVNKNIEMLDDLTKRYNTLLKLVGALYDTDITIGGAK